MYTQIIINKEKPKIRRKGKQMATYTDQLVVYNSGKIKKTSSGDTIQVTGNIHIEDGAYDLDIKSHDGTNGLKLAGTVVTSTAAELNILDGVTATASEINVLDGATNSNTTDGKAVILGTGGNLTLAGNLTVNGTTTTVNSTTVTIDDPIFTLGGDTAPSSDDNKDRGIEFRYYDTQARVGFMGWDDSASGFTLLKNATNNSEVFSGTAADLTLADLTFANLNDGTITIAGFVDEDNMSSDSATLVPTQQSVKAYVDAQITAQDLDIQGDDAIALSIDLDSETLTIAGGTGIETSGAGNQISVAIDSTVATLTGSQTLTNKTLTSAVLNGTISGTSIKDEDDMSSDSASHLATQQSIKAYVDSQTGGAASNSTTFNVAEAIAANEIVAIESLGRVSKSGTTNYEIVGVATAAQATVGSSVSVRTTPGGAAVTIKAVGTAVSAGDVLYASTGTAGACTKDVPTSGTVYRVGYATADESSDTVSVLWMPQFIAEL